MLIQLSALSEASVIIGWVYFAAWSISFWPQALLNYHRKSVTGLSFEFLAYNVTGFLCYSVYSTLKYFLPNGCGNTVEINDLAFGYHATILTLITILQCILYKTKRQKVHPIHAFLCASMWVIIGYTVILCFAVDIPFLPHCHSDLDRNNQPIIVTDTNFSLIDLLGYVKAAVSLIKYVPQVYLNWCRQSTVGWSIGNVLLDFTGGVLLFTQQGLDCVIEGSTEPITGNIPKLLLAAESLLFDVVFMVQHYVLYRGNKPITQQRQEEEEEGEEEGEEEEGENEQRRQGEEGDEGQGVGREGERADDQKRQKPAKSNAPRGASGEGEQQIEGRPGSGAGMYPSALPVRVGEEGSYHQLNDVDIQDDDYILEPGLSHSSVQYPQQRHPAGATGNTSSFSAARYPQPRWTPSPQQQQQPYTFRQGATNSTSFEGTYASPWPAIERR